MSEARARRAKGQETSRTLATVPEIARSWQSPVATWNNNARQRLFASQLRAMQPTYTAVFSCLTTSSSVCGVGGGVRHSPHDVTVTRMTVTLSIHLSICVGICLQHRNWVFHKFDLQCTRMQAFYFHAYLVDMTYFQHYFSVGNGFLVPEIIRNCI